MIMMATDWLFSRYQSRSDVTQWAVWLNDIPAFGYKKYIIRAIDDVPEPDINRKHILKINGTK